ncbi:MAG: hypothetical protein RL641_496 [Candidatus Parcubacteria bacterium]
MSDLNPENLVALVYVRVSTKKQDSKSQEHRCKQYAQMKGYEVEGVFPDKFTGGGDFWKRPAMRALMKHIDVNQISNPEKVYVVIFDDLKRFARDTEFHIRLRREFKSRDVMVECLNFNFEDSPVGRFLESISAAHNQMEREENTRQVIQKQQARLERGYWCFDAPPGLEYLKDPVHGKLLRAVEPKASIIYEALMGFAFDKFPEQVDVQNFLQSKDFFHRKRPKKVNLAQVYRMLTQILYTGYMEYAPRGITRRPGHFKGIITLDVFERIQNKLKGNAKSKARKDLHLDFPARGCVLCSECHMPFTASWTTKRNGYKRAYYRCNEPGCPAKNKSVTKMDIENGIAEILKTTRPSKEVLALTQEIALDVWGERTADSRQTELDMRKEIDTISAEINRFIERIAKTDNDAISTAFEQKIGELTNRKLLLEERLTTPDLYHGVSFETALDEVLGYIKNPYEIWSTGIFEDKRLVLRMVFEKPLVYNRKSGFETANLSLPIRLFECFVTPKSRHVEMGRIELPSKNEPRKRLHT